MSENTRSLFILYKLKSSNLFYLEESIKLAVNGATQVDGNFGIEMTKSPVLRHSF